MLDERQLVLVGDRPHPRHGGFLGAVVSDLLALLGSLADGGLRCLDRLCALGLGLVVGGLATDRAAKLADPFAKRTAELRQPFRAEDNKGDDQDDRELEGSDVWHHSM